MYYINKDSAKPCLYSAARSSLSIINGIDSFFLNYICRPPWNSPPRQKGFQASRPTWCPSSTFCHAGKKKEPRTRTPICHKNKSSSPISLQNHQAQNIKILRFRAQKLLPPSFHVPLNYSIYEYAQGLAMVSVYISKVLWFTHEGRWAEIMPALYNPNLWSTSYASGKTSCQADGTRRCLLPR